MSHEKATERLLQRQSCSVMAEAGLPILGLSAHSHRQESSQWASVYSSVKRGITKHLFPKGWGMLAEKAQRNA